MMLILLTRDCTIAFSGSSQLRPWKQPPPSGFLHKVSDLMQHWLRQPRTAIQPCHLAVLHLHQPLLLLAEGQFLFTWTSSNFKRLITRLMLLTGESLVEEEILSGTVSPGRSWTFGAYSEMIELVYMYNMWHRLLQCHLIYWCSWVSVPEIHWKTKKSLFFCRCP